MLHIEDPAQLQHQCLSWHLSGQKITLITALGTLHQGHHKMLQEARSESSKVVLTIIKSNPNIHGLDIPSVFARDFDINMVAAQGNLVDLVFTPTIEQLFADTHAICLDVPSLSRKLCGKIGVKPFQSSCALNLKLFQLSQASFVYFNQRDWQRYVILRQMAEDLYLPITLKALPISREADGLACSGFNSSLSEQQRKEASHIFQGLSLGIQIYHSGKVKTAEILKIIKDFWKDKFIQGEVQYLQIVNKNSLKRATKVDQDSMLITEISFGEIRILDNIFFKNDY